MKKLKLILSNLCACLRNLFACISPCCRQDKIEAFFESDTTIHEPGKPSTNTIRVYAVGSLHYLSTGGILIRKHAGGIIILPPGWRAESTPQD